jgi:MtN3 and saliva related transmembrane protein
MLLSHPTFRAAMDWTGSAAAVCTTISFLPQLLRVWRRKSASDISLTMFLLFNLGLALWLIYGIGIHSLPIVAANAVTLALALTILALKLKFDKTRV